MIGRIDAAYGAFPTGSTQNHERDWLPCWGLVGTANGVTLLVVCSQSTRVVAVHHLRRRGVPDAAVSAIVLDPQRLANETTSSSGCASVARTMRRCPLGANRRRAISAVEALFTPEFRLLLPSAVFCAYRATCTFAASSSRHVSETPTHLIKNQKSEIKNLNEGDAGRQAFGLPDLCNSPSLSVDAATTTLLVAWPALPAASRSSDTPRKGTEGSTCPRIALGRLDVASCGRQRAFAYRALGGRTSGT